MDSYNQKELIDDLKKGNKNSYSFLYATYGGKIYTLAYRMLGDIEEAKDVTQETFVQILRSIKDFKGNSNIYTWMYTIAQNLCYRSLKDRKKNSFVSLESLIYSVQSQGGSDEVSEFEKKYLINQVKEGCLAGLLRCLSFYQRISFILHILIGLSIKEVSQILDKSEGAVKVLIHRARENLKNFLCKNCSLYTSNNPCCCENLIDFSLNKGWIKKPSETELREFKSVDTEAIEKEIENFSKITKLYLSLSETTASADLSHRIQQVIESESWSIFQNKKV